MQIIYILIIVNKLQEKQEDELYLYKGIVNCKNTCVLFSPVKMQLVSLKSTFFGNIMIVSPSM